jgi:hypothetical protein
MLDRKESDKNRIRNNFIEKHRLRQLKSDDPLKKYYYDSVSKSLFELEDSGPVVFMKSSKEVEERILNLNEIWD